MKLPPFTTGEFAPSTAATVISDSDILRAADALAEYADAVAAMLDGTELGECIAASVKAYRKARNGERG